MTDNPLLLAALRYAANGWNVFPLHSIERGACTCRKPKCDSPGKHPRIDHWNERSTVDEQQIEAWWGEWPNANIGVATGFSSGVWVLDIDNKQTVEVGLDYVGLGDQSLRELEERYGVLPDSPTVQTGGGGYHVYFAWDEDAEIRNKARFKPGLDARGNGGYVVAPPSVHLSGHVYRWADDLANPVLAPNWLVEQVLAPVGPDGAGEDEWDFATPYPEGARNESLHETGAKLRRRLGLNELQLFGVLMVHNARQCIPPLEPDEVMRIAHNCAAYSVDRHMPSAEEFDDVGDKPPPEIKEGAHLCLTLSELMERPPVAPPPLVYYPGGNEVMLHAGTGMVLAGPPNAGKTWVGMDLMVGLASGGKWLGRYQCEPSRVLFVDEEGHPYGDHARLKKILDGRDYLSHIGLPLILSLGKGIRLDTEMGLTVFRRMLDLYQPNVVVLDSLVRFNSADENDARGMANFFHITKDLMKYYGIAFLFTHHVRKPSMMDDGDLGNSLRGTSEIRAWPDWISVLTADLVMHNVKQRWGRREDESLQISLNIDDAAGTAAPYVSGTIAKDDKSKAGQQNKILKAIQDLDDAGDFATIEAIADVVERSERTVRDYLNGMVQKGALEAEFGVTIPGMRGSKTVYHIK
jgi:hypothetical protein